MAYQHQVFPFVGDDDIDDFMGNVWVPFATALGWADVGGGAGEYWLSRTGPTPPYVFFRADVAKNAMSIFTGTGFDFSADIYDQPGNPCNGPNSSTYADLITNVARQKHQIINDVAGPYSAYWLFAPDDGSYIHCVLKVAPRHYRHFWVGMLTPLVAGLDPDSFYVCGHYWDRFPGGATQSGLSDAGEYAGPYFSSHRPPHGCYGGSTTLDGQKYQQASVFYMPNIRSAIDWWYSDNGSGTVAITKNVGGVNASLTVGRAQVAGYGRSLGAGLFQCDASFTAGIVPLIPIQVFGSFSFDSAERIGNLAQIPDVFRINIKSIAPEAEILVGSETYSVFPLTNVDSGNWVAGDPYSGYEGLAYRKIGS